MVIDQVLDPRTGYMVSLFQKLGRKQAYKNSLITTLLSGEHRTGTAGALLYALFRTDVPSSQYCIASESGWPAISTMQSSRDGRKSWIRPMASHQPALEARIP